MEYKTEKKISKDEYFIVTIRFSDPCKNGHNDFAITGEIYDKTYKCRHEGHIYREGKRHTLTCCGCLHDDIAKHFPEFQLFIDLHLSDDDGKPMYHIGNGFYHLGQHVYGGKDKKIVMNYLRINDDQLKELVAMSKEKSFKARYMIWIEDNMLDIWKKQAEEAKEVLSNLIKNAK